jgi:thiamine pyrophosphate-dependent acetolactate synthase large subunit-like protein
VARGLVSVRRHTVAACTSPSCCQSLTQPNHPSNLGLFGNVAHSVGTTAVSEADCIVAFGASLNVYTTLAGELVSGKKVVKVDDLLTATAQG